MQPFAICIPPTNLLELPRTTAKQDKARILVKETHVLNKATKPPTTGSQPHLNLAELPQIEEQATSSTQSRRAHQKQRSSSKNWNGRQQCACSASPVAPAAQRRRAAMASEQAGCCASVEPNPPAAAQASRHAARAACQVSRAIARGSACAKACVRVGPCAPYHTELSAALQAEQCDRCLFYCMRWLLVIWRCRGSRRSSMHRP